MSGDQFRLDGQLALVTGGSSGIGLATAEALIEAGAHVVITGRNEDALQETGARLGAGATVLRHDLAELDSIPPLVKQIEREIGPLSILINNAGNHLKKQALDTSDADLARIMGTQVAGTYALSRECGRSMVGRGAGSIVMIVSMAALFGIPLVSAYSTAKAGLVGLTRALATEFSPHGVRVNAIAPGFIDTPMSQRAMQNDPGRLAKVLGRTPAGRLGEGIDVGYAAVYLCSPAARFVTGVVLPVDGGASIGF
jgi:NAD(P)-dependent dehydrogenase (short-subunit alcohol dehydrogenase family)